MLLKHYWDIFFIFILTFVHAEVYTILETVAQITTKESLSYFLALVLTGITTFIFFIIFYNKVEKTLSFFKRYKKGKFLLIVFGSFIIYFNIILLHFTVPGLIHLITTLIIFERLNQK